jgi:flagellar biosynthetic protein FliR
MDLSPGTVLAVFLIFCRVGGCLMVMPGFSSSRVPVRVRLFIAVAITLAVTPLLFDLVRPAVGDGAPAALFVAIAAELATGFFIGVMARLFFLALQFVAELVAQSIGLAGIPGMAVAEDEQGSVITNLFTLTAIMLMFMTDQHWVLLRGLIDSYAVIQPAAGFTAQWTLIEVADQVTAVFLLALRIASPFIVYAIVVNLAVGLTNKLTPQIPVFFIAMPFVTAGGLMLLYFTMAEFMAGFTAAFAAWLLQG